jgi:hypothetical protein
VPPGFTITLDWVDLLALLLIVGVFLAITGTHPGIVGGKLLGGVFLAFYLARRRYFPPPPRGPLRRGLLWSIAGLATVFALVGGLILVFFAGSLWSASRAPAPDVTAAADRAADDQVDTDGLFDQQLAQIAGLSSDPAAEAARKASKDAAAKERHDAFVQKYIADRQAEWEAGQSKQSSSALVLLLVGLGLFVVGAVGDKARYEP